MTAAEIAAAWDITPSGVRSTLASRHIRRVSGYPAAQVRAVRREQGRRTDLVTGHATTSLTLTEAAVAIQAAPDPSTQLRVFFEFTRGAAQAGPYALVLVDDEPASTGDPRIDALLAGCAEYFCALHNEPAPLWTATHDRFLNTSWWLSTLPSSRAQALAWTPAPFRRRGIYLERRDLYDDGKGDHMPEPLFGADEVRHAFTMLAAKLERTGVVGQVHVIGGAAMLLAFDARTITRDIDAVFTPDGPMRAAIAEIAAEQSWPTTWLNDQACMYMARQPGRGATVFDHPHLQVMTTPPEHLLAMKVLAARSTRDREDVELLVGRLKITAAATVWDIVARFFPDEQIPARSRMFVEDILAALQK